jgi:DNA-binding SARP family transcriptional activator
MLRGEVRLAREWMAAWAELPAELDFAGRAEYFAVMGALLAAVEGSTRGALAALQGFGQEPTSFIASFSAYQLLSLGRVDEAEAMAERGMALALAGLNGGEWAESDLVETHQAAGEVSLERGNLAVAAGQLDEALRLARRIGNALAECATLVRLSEVALRRGEAAEALAHADAALELADRIGFSAFRSSARLHRGRALRARGDLDAAMSVLDAAMSVLDAAISLVVEPYAAGPLVEIGEIHLDRGEVAQAQSALERALAATDASGDVQPRSRALAALARLIAGESPEAALQLLEQGGPADAPSRWRSARRLAEGWVALRAGDASHAAALSDAVVEEAARQGDHAALAEGLALRCFSQPAPAVRVDPLVEATAIWGRLGYPLDHARAVLALRTLGADVDDAAVEQARSVLARQAVRVPGLGAGLGALIAVDSPAPLAIRTFGRFAVYRDGDEVPPTEWQSRKARDLLKLLVCRRGGVAVRDVLLEALWPDEDPGKTRNRLSVALNVVRGVLDPEGRFDADRFVVSDRDGLRLDLTRVDVDVEVFLARAKRAFEAARAGAGDARALLEEAEASYGGEFLEEDAFADWAAPLRERVRSAYVDLLRALARTEQESDRFHLRLLAVDSFDEDVHLDLVRMLSSTGRHGEARRAHRRYVTRMAEIGVEPEPLDLAGGRRDGG